MPFSSRGSFVRSKHRASCSENNLVTRTDGLRDDTALEGRAGALNDARVRLRRRRTRIQKPVDLKSRQSRLGIEKKDVCVCVFPKEFVTAAGVVVVVARAKRSITLDDAFKVGGRLLQGDDHDDDDGGDGWTACCCHCCPFS